MTVFEVYGLFVGDSSAIRYVGVTTKGIEQRLVGHRYAAAHGINSYLCKWMRKVGSENVKTRLLCQTVTYEDMMAAERWWIAELRSMGFKLCNMTDGGEGVRGTPEVRRKIGDALRGRPNPYARNRVHTPQERRKRSESVRRSWTPESRVARRIAAQQRFYDTSSWPPHDSGLIVAVVATVAEKVITDLEYDISPAHVRLAIARTVLSMEDPTRSWLLVKDRLPIRRHNKATLADGEAVAAFAGGSSPATVESGR